MCYCSSFVFLAISFIRIIWQSSTQKENHLFDLFIFTAFVRPLPPPPPLLTKEQMSSSAPKVEMLGASPPPLTMNIGGTVVPTADDGVPNMEHLRAALTNALNRQVAPSAAPQQLADSKLPSEVVVVYACISWSRSLDAIEHMSSLNSFRDVRLFILIGLTAYMSCGFWPICQNFLLLFVWLLFFLYCFLASFNPPDTVLDDIFCLLM